MRVAIVSDIHGNRTAFEAVLADLGQISPDLVLHGGDLAHGGAGAAPDGVLGGDDFTFGRDRPCAFLRVRAIGVFFFSHRDSLSAVILPGGVLATVEKGSMWLRGWEKIHLAGR